MCFIRLKISSSTRGRKECLIWKLNTLNMDVEYKMHKDEHVEMDVWILLSIMSSKLTKHKQVKRKVTLHITLSSRQPFIRLCLECKQMKKLFFFIYTKISF